MMMMTKMILISKTMTVSKQMPIALDLFLLLSNSVTRKMNDKVNNVFVPLSAQENNEITKKTLSSRNVLNERNLDILY